MNDTISRQEAKDAIDMALDHIDHVPPWVYDKLLNALNEVPSAEKAQLSEEGTTFDIPSAEPKTPSNGSITCVKSEKMHDRTTDGLISREDVCEVVKNEMESWLEGDRCDYRNVVDAIMDLPSAGGCKCPCEYREPCDVCHYDGHLGLGCPAEEGLRDERLD